MEVRKLVKDNVKDMGMVDIILNQYFAKDGLAWYRNYEREVPVNDLIREVAKTIGVELPIDDEELGELLCDWSQYEVDSKEGILALFHCSMWGMATLREVLKDYEEVRKE